MKFMNARWWRLFLPVCSGFIVYAGATGRFQIPTPQEVVHNATFIPSGQSPTSTESSTTELNGDFSQLIFPFMNFTCNTSIIRLMFVARLQGRSCSLMETLSSFGTWPHFYLWRYSSDGHSFNRMRSIGPSIPEQLVCIHTSTDDQIRLIEVRLGSVQVEEGDILGLQQQKMSTQGSIAQPAMVSVLRQRRGYGLTFFCDEDTQQCIKPSDRVTRDDQQMPLIAINIETALSDQECAVGFLDERSLQTIVDVPNDRSTDDHPSIFTYGTPQPATLSMPLNQSGTLKKLIAAAEFDVTVSAGWPELQIIRNAAIVFSTGIREPKPTGYLNVYKYDDVSADMFEIKAGDVLGISWHTNALNPNLNRFSLAYYNYTGILSSDIPIVSIVVGDCDPEADLLTLDTLYCEEPTDSTTMSTRTKSQEFNLITISTSVVISVVVSCSLLLSIVIVIMFVVCQHTENK